MVASCVVRGAAQRSSRAGLASLASLRSAPILASSVSASASAATSTSASTLASSSSSSSSFLRSTSRLHTSAYASLALTRSGPAFTVARSSLLTGSGSFAAPVASRNLSFWGSSKSNPAPASTAESNAETLKDEATEKAEQLMESAGEQLQNAESAASHAVNSVENAAADLSSSVQDAASSVSQRVSESVSQVDASAVSTVTEAFSSAMGVKVGELVEAGLAHGYSPVGWITHLLDFVGTNTGLPWWGTIMVTTVILRLAIAPINIAGQKNAIKLGNIQPQLKKNMDDIKHYKATGDQMAMQKAVFETQKLMRETGTNPLKSFVPILFQFPLMFSFYLALKRVADKGLESFAHGGPSWTMDLCQPDPTYALPIVSMLATLAVAEVGFKTGTTGQSDPNQAKMMKYIFRGSMPVIGYIASSMPSGVLVYWATTNIYSLLQLLTLQIPAVRQLAKFPKRIQHPKNPYEQPSKGWADTFKAARDRMSDSAPAQPKPVTPVSSSSSSNTGSASAGSRSEALKEILDDKAAYESGAPSAREAELAAQRNRERVIKARQRRGGRR
ncbi:hypothetical protein BCV70DRAFT_201661 [Testicularia cyperi]|uniref:Membrane insertase YidC/Oxa/ALB C-terminal domain-containing protein n=1 Tax=Testicularia cyperi TaxID=1882483 RepID=A0A317XKR4_9BASI|nr:hypothetical protein BCV70DRAFT_201661 [Testicularia cyperi]